MRRQWLLATAVLLAPLALIALWGAGINEVGYPALRYAQNLAAGRGLLFDAAAGGVTPPLTAPLWTAVLALLAAIGAPLETAALALSGLGWGAAGLALIRLGRVMGRPTAGWLAAGLLVVSPLVVETRGTAASWVIALGLSALWLAATGRRVGTAVLAALGVGYWALVIGYWLLITDHWIPITGYGSLAGMAVVGTAVLFLVGLGADWLADWLEAGGRVRLAGRPLRGAVAALIMLPLLAAGATSLAGQYAARPMALRALEAQTAAWIAANTGPDDAVYGPARVALLADRPRLPGDPAAPLTPGMIPTGLVERRPAVLVVQQTAAWDLLARTGWFQSGYRPGMALDAPSVSTAPFEVWTAVHDTVVRLPGGPPQPALAATGRGFELTGYEVAPRRIGPLRGALGQAQDKPGGAVEVTLFLRATEPVTTAFQTVVRLVDPISGEAVAQRDVRGPRSFPLGWWAAGETIPERFVLTPTADIVVGAYELNVSWRAPLEDRLWPLALGDEGAEVDRVALGYVAVLSDESPTGTPSGATFGQLARLVSYKLAGQMTAGETLRLTLFWRALGETDEELVVFVHLLDEAGALAATGDGPPMNGRFPTAAWLPGDVIPDEHVLSLPPDLPPGDYRLQVGFYRPETGERLPAWDGSGAPAANGAVRLGP